VSEPVYGKHYHFGLGTLLTSNGTDRPALIVQPIRGPGGEVGSFTPTDPPGVTPRDPDNLILEFHTRAGLHALIAALLEVDKQWDGGAWPKFAAADEPVSTTREGIE
jgi:hypothetical protein